MATAILVVYTHDGFVVCADRRKARRDGSVVDDDAQKLFPVNGKALAYGLAGTVQFTNGCDEIVFDLVSKMHGAVDSVGASDPCRVRRWPQYLVS
jgi:hypothetical protein